MQNKIGSAGARSSWAAGRYHGEAMAKAGRVECNFVRCSTFAIYLAIFLNFVYSLNLPRNGGNSRAFLWWRWFSIFGFHVPINQRLNCSSFQLRASSFEWMNLKLGSRQVHRPSTQCDIHKKSRHFMQPSLVWTLKYTCDVSRLCRTCAELKFDAGIAHMAVRFHCSQYGRLVWGRWSWTHT